MAQIRGAAAKEVRFTNNENRREIPCARQQRRYSIIVCTHNRANLLRASLQAITKEMMSTRHVGELIVVDNGSTDSTYDIYTSTQDSSDGLCLKYFYVPELGLSIARNRGVNSAEGEILIFVDDDAVVAEGWLESCLKAFRDHPQAEAVGGQVVPQSSVPLPEWLVPPLTGLYSIIDLDGDDVRPFRGKGLPVGANMALRRSVFAYRHFSPTLGRIGTSLVSGEEAEILLAIRQRGKEILYVPSMRVEHFIDADRLTEDWAVRRSYFAGLSQARLQLGRLQFGVDFATHCFRGLWLLISRPLARSSFERLVWRCRIQKTIGFFDETARQLARWLPGSNHR
jgi:glucosyl-dolichyl phosphate glucuronosyltransferase